jgi:hypothetical protein
MNKKNAFSVCPNCGANVPANAKACRECGSDDSTGWSEQTYLDGISLPNEDEYDELYDNEFGTGSSSSSRRSSSSSSSSTRWIWITGVILLVVFGLLIIKNLI